MTLKMRIGPEFSTREASFFLSERFDLLNEDYMEDWELMVATAEGLEQCELKKQLENNRLRFCF